MPSFTCTGSSAYAEPYPRRGLHGQAHSELISVNDRATKALRRDSRAGSITRDRCLRSEH